MVSISTLSIFSGKSILLQQHTYLGIGFWTEVQTQKTFFFSLMNTDTFNGGSKTVIFCTVPSLIVSF